MDTMMMMPPIEGTLIFFTPKGSMEASRCVSLMWWRFIQRMKYSPNHAEMTRARMSARSERKEMYDHMAEPGTPNCSRKRKR